MCFSLTACGKKGENNNNANTNEQVQEDSSELAETEPLETEKVPLEDDKKDIVETEEPAPTEEPLETEEPVEEEPIKIVGLPNDIYSFQMALNGDLYDFPMSYVDFITYGWTLDGDDTITLNPDQYSMTQTFRNGEMSCFVNIINFDINSQPVPKCSIGSFIVDAVQLKRAECEILLPGGIVFGVSTKDDLIAAYGKPSETSEKSNGIELVYKKGTYQYVKFRVDYETNVLTYVDIHNFDKKKNNVQSSASKEVPAIVTKYKTPKALGDDILAFKVEYAGALYQLPAPVSALLANGWKITDEYADLVVKANSSEWISLTKDGMTLDTIIRNYDDKANYSENCFVTTLKSTGFSTIIPIKLPKNITIGMSFSSFEAALAGVYYEEDTESNNFRYFRIKDPNSSIDYIDIVIDKETNTVHSIEVSYTPKKESLYK